MGYLVQGKKDKWEIVIGLEVHCQIVSQAKLFSGASATFGGEPNEHVSYIDAGLPGVLPRPNRFCIEQAIKTGLALNGTINLTSFFDRKHYFYPDLPFGYQITQFYKPIMENGSLQIEVEDGTTKTINITRLHIEQDAGKLLHDHHGSKSFVDLNRAGVGLMEIVSEPEIRSKEEAASYVNNLRVLVRSLGTCDGNMEEGSMRCDVNISVRKPNEPFRTRVEIKNINSVRFLQQAIDFEVAKQIEEHENGITVVQETKLFDSSTGRTYSLRTKEDTGDYRYVRDPDLLPLILEKSYVELLKDTLPELPQARKERFIKVYGLTAQDAALLVNDNDCYDFYEKAVIKDDKSVRNPKLVFGWFTTNLFALLKQHDISIKDSPITPKLLGELVDLIEDNSISGKIAKEVFDIMWNTKDNPKNIVEKHGLKQITDDTMIEAVINKLVEANQDKVLQIKQGKDKLMGWFVGQVMAETKGKANPEIVNLLLKKKILE